MRNEPSDQPRAKPEPSVARGLGALAAILGLLLAFAWGVAALVKWVV